LSRLLVAFCQGTAKSAKTLVFIFPLFSRLQTKLRQKAGLRQEIHVQTYQIRPPISAWATRLTVSPGNRFIAFCSGQNIYQCQRKLPVQSLQYCPELSSYRKTALVARKTPTDKISLTKLIP
jgi:hypothetical protein